MDILIISQYFWPENFRINDIALGLVERGHRVTVVTGMPNYPTGKLFPGYHLFRPGKDKLGGVRILRTPLLPRGSGRKLRLALNYLSFCLGAGLGVLLKRLPRVDAILVYEPSPITVGIPAILAKIRLQAPMAFWVQDLWPESLSATGALTNKGVLRAVELLVRVIYAWCDLILVQSRMFVPSVQRLCFPGKPIQYLPNSAESLYEPLVPRDVPEIAALMPKGFRITFAGNIGAAQDLGTMLDAATLLRSIPDLHWVVLGDGRMFGWLQSEVTKRGLEGVVHLLGRYPADRMPAFFAHSEAVLAILKADPIFASTIPSKIQAYLASGRPILAALDGEGSRIVIEAGAGLACPAGDSRRLARIARQLYGLAPAERERMGAKGRSYFLENFDRETVMDQLTDGLAAIAREEGACAC